jgi:SAM-dependent methyltransferase
MTTEADTLREEIRRRYAVAATVAAGGKQATDGPDDACFGTSLYDDLDGIPEGAGLASLGCGNPIAVADLVPGETVLDLGSGGGIDVLLSAKRVGPTGHAYGLDMTEEMLALARRNAAEAGTNNVTFLRGQIEEIPLPDATVDVIISNCVINLSTDKPAVFHDTHRVLRGGGRIGISDVVADDNLAPTVILDGRHV